MYVGKARSLPKIGGSERCSNRVDSGVTSKHWTRHARDKHSRLLETLINHRQIILKPLKDASLQPLSKTLDLAGKVGQGKTL
jgi:hypothetical protein